MTSGSDGGVDAGRGGRGGPRFLVLDGIDGCGKTTQSRRLVQRLAEARGVDPLHLREPGSTAAGERLRGLLLDPEVALVPEAEVLLFAAARRQMLAELVEPALGAGRDVVCERFHASTYAYQAAAGGLEGERVLALLASWCGAPAPDRTVLLDVSPAKALERRRGRSRRDRFEERGAAFHERVAAGYRRYAELAPEAVLVPGEGSPDEVFARVWREVAPWS